MPLIVWRKTLKAAAVIESLTQEGVTVRFYKAHLTVAVANSSPVQTLILPMF